MTFAVRALSPTGDYTFGQGNQNYLRDTPAAVAQACLTRLLLWEGEWFLDLTEGTPWWQQVLAQKNIGLATTVLRERILGTPFAVNILNFSVVFNNDLRTFSITGILVTAFGQIPISFPAVAAPGTFSAGGSALGSGSGGLG